MLIKNHSFQLFIARPSTGIVYIDVQPNVSLIGKIVDRLVHEVPPFDALVVGVYDSGKVPNSFGSHIQRATDRNIAVFGIRQTLFVNNEFDLTQGSAPYDAAYEMQPPILRAGLVPLQAYPPNLLKMADELKRLRDVNPNFPIENAVINLSGEFMGRYILLGLEQICKEQPTRQDRIREARRRFSSPRFNERIDEVLRKEKLG